MVKILTGLLVLITFTPTANAATIVYTYAGTPFDRYHDWCGAGVECTYTDPTSQWLRAQTFIYASVTLDVPLGMSASGLQPTAWSIGSTTNIYSPITSTIFDQCALDNNHCPFGVPIRYTAAFAVDETGAITDWTLIADVRPKLTFQTTSSGGDYQWKDSSPMPSWRSSQPGTWSAPPNNTESSFAPLARPAVTATVPDASSSLLLLAPALLGMALWRR